MILNLLLPAFGALCAWTAAVGHLGPFVTCNAQVTQALFAGIGAVFLVFGPFTARRPPATDERHGLSRHDQAEAYQRRTRIRRLMGLAYLAAGAGAYVTAFLPENFVTFAEDAKIFLLVVGLLGALLGITMLTFSTIPYERAQEMREKLERKREDLERTRPVTASEGTPAPGTSATASHRMGSSSDRLKELESLHAQGLLTDEEYSRKRGQIVESI